MVGLLSAVGTYFRNWLTSFKEAAITLEYPFAARTVFQRAHTQLKIDFRECTGCYECQRLCPVAAIAIRSSEFSGDELRPLASNGMTFQARIHAFEVNYASCTLCGICVAACPTDALGYSSHALDPELSVDDLRVDLARQKKNRLVINGQTPWKDT